MIKARHAQTSAVTIAVLMFLILGCAASKPNPEVQARQAYAEELDRRNVIAHASYFASGPNRDVLEVSVLDSPPSDPEFAIEFLAGDDVRSRAKELGFKEIRIKGSPRDFTSPDWLKRAIPLK